MKDFKVNEKFYLLDEHLRDTVKPGWQEMLEPARGRFGKRYTVTGSMNSVLSAENILFEHGFTLVGKHILEVGCNEGSRSYLMAKYQDTYVHGIDVNEYTVEQSPDMNSWNPNDVKFIDDGFKEVRNQIASKFPEMVSRKVSFQTVDICDFYGTPFYDVLISWDTLEHLLDLPRAFKNMNGAMVTNGIAYHEYNPFFAVNGGHSLCTLDFLYGHCRLKADDFERYVREMRPVEEKIGINFYHKCLNRASIAEVKQYAEDAGFEILYFKGTPSFTEKHALWRDRIDKEFLPEVKALYPSVVNEDLFCGSIAMVLRKR